MLLKLKEIENAHSLIIHKAHIILVCVRSRKPRLGTQTDDNINQELFKSFRFF